jgi:chemosensory pili system protein ChpA (sensor histidine kinase/response regulator)
VEPVTTVSEAQPESVAPAPTFQPAADTLPSAAEQRPPAAGRREQIRVPADLLDKLVNNAGEVSIYRSRIEQQNTTLGFNLNELEQTVERLRSQLRSLDIETEAQILFRFEREKEERDAPERTFDPLEMDRFSNIQQLSRSLLETVNDLTNINGFLEDLHKETETLLLQQARVANDLQDGLLRTRMVPFSQLVPRLQRLVRQTAAMLGKQAELRIRGAEGELDRSILDRMIGPVEHILRNAVSHGIETVVQRERADKPRSGRIDLNLVREGNDVVLSITDDGAGLDTEAIRRQAIENGLLAAEADLPESDIIQFVLEHGFSTQSEVTQISGRGVGLDVVIKEVKNLGGSLDIDSERGKGTTFVIRLPLTLAISDALLVELGDEIYAVPHVSIEGVVRLGKTELLNYYDGRSGVFNYAGHDYRVQYLGSLLNVCQFNLAEQRKWYPLLLVRAGDHRVALQVDGLIGNRQIVVKSVGPQISTVRWISGGTILGDGRVALILDVTALVRMDVAQALPSQVSLPPAIHERQQRTVMVVDDSITVRKVTGRVLERNGMKVITAKDGVDAVAQLQEQLPDIMLLDIEMPRMDGYELARHMRNTEELKSIPIIMITSRTGDKHRKLALDLGVKRYLGKPYQESELLDNIYSLLAEESP